MFETLFTILFPHAKKLFIFALLFLLLESLIPAQKSQKIFRKDLKLDYSYSFFLTLLFYPVKIFLFLYLANYFYGTVGMPDAETKGRINYSIGEEARNGIVKVQPDGKIKYKPKPGFSGLDAFVLKKSDGENEVAETILVQVEPLSLKGEESFSGPQVAFKFFSANSVTTGKVTQGFSGWFYKTRKLILEQNVILQIFLAVLLVDFVGYWRHRLMHSKYLWPFHTIHHCSREIDWISTDRFHPVNHIISGSLTLLVLTALFEDPYVSATATFLRRGYGLFIHSNLQLSYGFMDYIFISPLFHRWHHSDSAIVKYKNYSTFFSFFDLVFGSYYLPKQKCDPKSFGFYGGELTSGLVGQTIYPFVKLAEIFKASRKKKIAEKFQG